LRRSFYLQICMFPAVTATTCFLMIMDPGTDRILEAARSFYEALTLYRFGMLLFILVMYESSRIAALGQADEADGVNDMDPASIVVALAVQGKRKHFGVPPLGCCLRPCMRASNLTLVELRCVWWMIHQYVINICLTNVLQVYLLSVLPFKFWVVIARWLSIVNQASNIVCIYGLMVLFFATQDLLKQWSTKSKFVAIKFVLIILIYQSALIHHFAEPLINRTDSCMRYVGYAEDPRDDGGFSHWAEVEAAWYCQWALVLETIPMAIMITTAFPVEELQRVFEEVHHEFLEMGMRFDACAAAGSLKPDEDPTRASGSSLGELSDASGSSLSDGATPG